jgi:fibronectin type 3 domain-containing protein
VNFSANALTVLATELVTLTATWNGVSQKDVLQLQGTTSSQPSTASEVQLNWDAPNASSDPIAGYHVYRTTGSSSNYSMLSTLDTQTTYTDTTVQSGATYDYIVKSVDTNGVESGPSNPVSVTIP